MVVHFFIVCSFCFKGCPPGWTLHRPNGIDMCYIYYKKLLNYPGAVATCKMMGGEVVMPKTINEQNAMKRTVQHYNVATWEHWFILNVLKSKLYEPLFVLHIGIPFFNIYEQCGCEIKKKNTFEVFFFLLNEKEQCQIKLNNEIFS